MSGEERNFLDNGQWTMYWRFASGLRDFLRCKISLEDARAIIRRRMEEREKNFLRLMERGIFGHPGSPYLPLLEMAGCEMGDIVGMVGARGLEATLRQLREDGVYITFEEFKGRKPIERHGRVIPAKARDFDNPYLSCYYRASTGGTTGPGTRVDIDLDHLAAQAPSVMLGRHAHGLLHMPSAIWLGTLPDGSGPNNVLRPSRFGDVPRRWFTSVRSRDLRPSIKYRLANMFIITMGRVSGVPIPWPEEVRLDQAGKVAGWMDRIIREHGACLLATHPSKALRVCLAAVEEGIDLTGAVFIAGGEPPTPAKVRRIKETGARWVPVYPFSETGNVGFGCGNPADENDLHFFRDMLALIQAPRKVEGTDVTVETFYFSSLLPTAPKLMLNVESDDYGMVERRSCGCPLESAGYVDHLRQIRSFRKLTGEGVTLMGSEMVNIMEEVLPERFGGSPLDYQLLEEEDEGGFTRLSLLVSPKIETADEKKMIDILLEAMGKGSVAADQARAIWKQAGTLSVKRMDPILTPRGKLMPLHLKGPPSRSPGG